MGHQHIYCRSVFLLLAVGVFFTLACNRKSALENASEIHARLFTVDSHVDTPLRLLRSDYNLGERHEANQGKVDFIRMREGGLDAIFFAVFVGQRELTDKGYEKARKRALALFSAIDSSLNRHPNLASLALSPEDAYRLEDEDKRAVFIGMENGYPLGKDLSLVKSFHDLGSRYITLCHTKHNQICDSSTDDNGPLHGGLSEFGKQVVAEMNKLGMMIDLSHASDQSFYDVLKVTKAPVIASHSCARAVCDHPRNLSDDMLLALKKNGGVIQMCILSAYVKTPPVDAKRDSAVAAFWQRNENYDEMTEEEQKRVWQEWRQLNRDYPEPLATISDMADHIDHIVSVAGIDHVGIGTDFDGGGGLEDCRDVSEMPAITRELLRRGYSVDDLEKIWGGNLMRVMREVQSLSAQNI
jgi:membrane dipeptidase